MHKTEHSVTITRRGDSWGETGQRTHEQDSTLTLQHDLGAITVTVKQGAINSHNPEHSRPEGEARIRLDLADVRALAALVTELPAEDA